MLTATEGTDIPVAGFYRLPRTSTGRIADRDFDAIRIWFGPPRDPDTGEEMDRSPRWQVTVNGYHYWPSGAEVEPEHVWPRCGRWPITEWEHDVLMEMNNGETR